MRSCFSSVRFFFFGGGGGGIFVYALLAVRPVEVFLFLIFFSNAIRLSLKNPMMSVLLIVC